MSSFRIIVVLALLLLTGCGGIQDDLFPSGTNKVPPIPENPTSIGPSVGQYAPDFTLSDTLNNTVTLSSVYPNYRGIVMYFTMWCPTCDSHMSYLRDNVIPVTPDIVFYAVDYVSATVADSASAESSYGYTGSGFVVLADTARTVLNQYNATMATTVVIDRHGVIQMNEGFLTDRLQSVLATLQ